MLCGSGLLVTVIAPLRLSIVIAERTTTVPRLKGPALAGTSTFRPNGASP